MIAGGSVLRTLLVAPGSGFDSNTSDIDVFFYGDSDKQVPVSLLAERIFKAVAVDGERWGLSRTSNVINIIRYQHVWSMEVDAHVQLVLHIFKNAAEILTGFDVDCSAIGFDGSHVVALPRAIRALERGYNVVNPLHSWPNRATYELRLVKYAFRGFGKLEGISVRGDERRAKGFGVRRRCTTRDGPDTDYFEVPMSGMY